MKSLTLALTILSLFLNLMSTVFAHDAVGIKKEHITPIPVIEDDLVEELPPVNNHYVIPRDRTSIHENSMRGHVRVHLELLDSCLILHQEDLLEKFNDQLDLKILLSCSSGNIFKISRVKNNADISPGALSENLLNHRLRGVSIEF